MIITVHKPATIGEIFVEEFLEPLSDQSRLLTATGQPTRGWAP
jgi:plasmid maintenance system antidote protein VapI